MHKLSLSKIVGGNNYQLVLKPENIHVMCYFDISMLTKDCYNLYFIDTSTCLASLNKACLLWKAF